MRGVGALLVGQRGDAPLGWLDLGLVALLPNSGLEAQGALLVL